jgi:hypothetical protein
MSESVIVASADREVVKRLCEHLLAAFGEFADQMQAQSEEGLRYIDAYMGAHNFHKAVILELESREPRWGRMLRDAAVETLRKALE